MVEEEEGAQDPREVSQRVRQRLLIAAGFTQGGKKALRTHAYAKRKHAPAVVRAPKVAGT